jgi:hypothetical protein
VNAAGWWIRLLGIAIAAVVSADAIVIGQASRPDARQPVCLPSGSLPPRTSLQVTLRITSAHLRQSEDANGVATVTNSGPAPIVVRNTRAVLVVAGEQRALTPASVADVRERVITPGRFVEIPFVVHVDACTVQDRAALVPGFIEVVLLLDVSRSGGNGTTESSPPSATVLSD